MTGMPIGIRTKNASRLQPYYWLLLAGLMSAAEFSGTLSYSQALLIAITW